MSGAQAPGTPATTQTSGTPNLATVASPCIGICRIDAAAPWCTGCHRTLDEIAAWSALDDAGKRAVLARVAARRAGA